MATRKRRSRRRETSYQAAAQPSGSRPSAPMSQHRSTFRVARAMRQAAVDLPDSVQVLGARRVRQGVSPSEQSRAMTLDQGAAKRSPSRSAKRPARPESLSMAKDNPKLKCRPDGRSKSGSGKSRDFIPWGKC